MLGKVNDDEIDSTGGDGLQLFLTNNELVSAMPPLPDLKINDSNMLLTELDNNDTKRWQMENLPKKPMHHQQ